MTAHEHEWTLLYEQHGSWHHHACFDDGCGAMLVASGDRCDGKMAGHHEGDASAFAPDGLLSGAPGASVSGNGDMVGELWEVVGLAEAALSESASMEELEMAFAEFWRHVNALRSGRHWLTSASGGCLPDAPAAASVSGNTAADVIREALEQSHARMCGYGEAWRECALCRGALAMLDALVAERNEARAEAVSLGDELKRSNLARHAAEAELAQARAALDRAVYLGEHLHAMVPREVWRDHGADDGQGHYEGDYNAEQVADELRALAGVSGPPADTEAKP